MESKKRKKITLKILEDFLWSSLFLFLSKSVPLRRKSSPWTVMTAKRRNPQLRSKERSSDSNTCFNGPSRPHFHLFLSFQSNNTIFTSQCIKIPSSKRCWDSNPRPLEFESSPIATRPGLPLFTKRRLTSQIVSHVNLQSISNGPAYPEVVQRKYSPVLHHLKLVSETFHLKINIFSHFPMVQPILM